MEFHRNNLQETSAFKQFCKISFRYIIKKNRGINIVCLNFQEFIYMKYLKYSSTLCFNIFWLEESSSFLSDENLKQKVSMAIQFKKNKNKETSWKSSN